VDVVDSRGFRGFDGLRQTLHALGAIRSSSLGHVSDVQ
jgi:hypothetical protein